MRIPVFLPPLMIFVVLLSFVILPLPFRIRLAKGDSMFPTFSDSEAVLVAWGSDVEVGNIAVYRRDGSLIGHRVISIGDGVVLFRGDNNQWTEEVPVQDILGKIVAHCPSFLFVTAFFFSALASGIGVIYELSESRAVTFIRRPHHI